MYAARASQKSISRKSALSSNSRRARRRQFGIVAVWFAGIGLTFLLLITAFGSARAATATIQNVAPHVKIVPKPIKVSRYPLQCSLSSSGEDGFFSIIIGNSSAQVIEKRQMIFYEMGFSKDEPVHGVNAPVLIPVGQRFSVLVQSGSDLRAGSCQAWIYLPLEGIQSVAVP